MKASLRKGEKRMRKRMLGVLLAALLLPGLALPVRAAEGRGSIQVTLKSGEVPLTGGTVTLYRVGERFEDGYRITDTFGGGFVRHEDAFSPQLAQWLAQREGEPGMTRILDADGSASFSRLEEGLYLLIQNGTVEDFFPIMPFLMILPYEGQWNVEAYPFTQQVFTECPRTGQSPMPFLGAIGMVFSGVGLAVCAGRKRKR